MSETHHVLLTFGETLWEASQTLLPIAVFFMLFQLIYLKLPREFVINVGKGMILCLVGLSMFLLGVVYGFLPAGEKMGITLGELENRWVMIPLGFVLGFISTLAEPAVRVFSYEVDKTSSGNIHDKVVLYAIALGVAMAVALGMARVIYGFPIQFLLVPGYLLILLAMKFASTTFVSVAFDSGGVVTGPMITTFVVAITLGAAEIMQGRDPITDGFGLIALVAMVPILIVMVLGILFERKSTS